jgi:superfamily I DNA/RNA helicase
MAINWKKLNPAQRDAVQTVEGPVLVVAGAGTGKTRTIAYRTVHMLNSGVAPENILGITFTNKAARSMRERVSGLVGRDTAARIPLSTIHALCARILREDIFAMGRDPQFTIFDTADQISLIRTAMAEHGLDPRRNDPSTLQFRFSTAKNEGGDASDIFNDPQTLGIYNRYNVLLEKNNALDFDDLLMFAARLLGQNKQVLAKYQDRFRYMMVDEYQDINNVQYELLFQLAKARNNIYAVGDEDQSIYGWRGARMDHIQNFEKAFPGARIIKLESNYRSTRQILEASNLLISHNTGRRDKKLVSARGPGFGVRVLAAASDRDEAAAVIDRIISEKHQAHLRYSDFGVLFRTNAQSRIFEEMLINRGIAYVLVGGTKFYERKEIKDLFAYLRFGANPQDAAALDRVINYPTRGIGKKSMDTIVDCAMARGEPVGFVLRDEAILAQLPDRARAGVEAFTAIMDEFRERSSRRPIADSIRWLIEKLQFKEILEKATENVNDARRRLENMHELVSSMADYEAANKEPSLAGFLGNAALLTDERESDDDLKEDSVALMTMHSAKGLEFTVAFVVGCEEGYLPHDRSMDTDYEIQEERRLMYVGMTRAMKRLFLSWSSARRKFGEMVRRKPSRFLAEIESAVEYDSIDDIKQQAQSAYSDIAKSQMDRFKKLFDDK